MGSRIVKFIPPVIGAFHVRDDSWIIKHKLDIYSRFCDAIVVVLDRSPQATRDAVRRCPKAIAIEHENSLDLPDEGTDGPVCEEGVMYQEQFEAAADLLPLGGWMILGDADEVPTPHIVDFLASNPQDAECWQLDWVQLYKTDRKYVSGSRCIWSHEHPKSNKKGVILKYNPARSYSYPLMMFRHCRPEPRMTDGRPLNIKRIAFPKLLHYKFVNWDLWEESAQSKIPKYVDYWKGLEISETPESWLWRREA